MVKLLRRRSLYEAAILKTFTGFLVRFYLEENVNCQAPGLKTDDLFLCLESDCLYKLCIYSSFFFKPGVMLKHLVICEQLLCCSVN